MKRRKVKIKQGNQKREEQQYKARGEGGMRRLRMGWDSMKSKERQWRKGKAKEVEGRRQEREH